MAYGSKVKRDTPEGMHRRKATHKIRMKTNNKEDTYLWQLWQYSRKGYNFCLGYHKLTLKMRLPCFRLRVWVNRVKKHRFPWAVKFPQIPLKNMIYNLENTLARFYISKKKGENDIGYPRFKNIKEQPFLRLDNGRGSVPVFKGKMMTMGRSWGKYRQWRLTEALRFKEGEICQVTLVREERGVWDVCVTVEILEPIPEIPEENIGKNAGGDHGIGDTLFAYSDDGFEDTWDNPRFYREAEEDIAQLDREIARSFKQNDGDLTKANEGRQKQRRKIHRKVKNRRNDYLHKMTTKIANRPISRLVIESPNANAWARHPSLSKSTYDAAPGTITTMLTYKGEAKGIEIEQADRHFASTKSCSNPECDWIWRDMKLSDRVFICQKCGLSLDRDINAARNLKRWTKNKEHLPSSGSDFRDDKCLSEPTISASDKTYPQSKVLESAKACQVRQLV